VAANPLPLRHLGELAVPAIGFGAELGRHHDIVPPAGDGPANE
jgi:hypothetical protein